MAVLNVLYQDMREEVLDQAKKVSLRAPHTNKMFPWQLILDVFEVHKEERVIANKIRQEFDKLHGKCCPNSRCKKWKAPSLRCL